MSHENPADALLLPAHHTQIGGGVGRIPEAQKRVITMGDLERQIRNAEGARLIEPESNACDECNLPLDSTDSCPRCGVYHGDPCPECERRGYHVADCSEMNEVQR